jgi:hypothetical protein
VPGFAARRAVAGRRSASWPRPRCLRERAGGRTRHGGQQRGRTVGGFCAAGFAVELTHRAKRGLFGLAVLTLVREVAPPRRTMPGRRRPAAIPLADPVTGVALPERALTPVE